MKAKVPRDVLLAVAEVESMIASLDDAKTGRNLSGRQRQQLQEAHDELVEALNRARKGEIWLPIPVVVNILRCATMTQQWVSDMLTELSVEHTDE
jgi:hypothetical protein